MGGGLSFPDLIVEDFVLKPLCAADTTDLLTLFSDPEVTEFMDIPSLTDVDEARDIIDWAMSLARQGRGVRWGIRRNGHGSLIGTAGFNRIERDRGRLGEIAYDLARAEWGSGVMSRILPRIIDFGFQDLALRRLEAMVTAGNQRSSTLLGRHGFELEGRLRDYGFWKGRYWDQLIYSRLAD